jgi:hypothetical protein
MLPPEVEKTLKKLGPDGEKVRGTLEREFASYLEEKAPQRKERDLGATAAVLLGGAFKPVITRLGKQLAERALDPDGPSFADGMRRARERARGATNGAHAADGSKGAEPGTDRPTR